METALSVLCLLLVAALLIAMRQIRQNMRYIGQLKRTQRIHYGALWQIIRGRSKVAAAIAQKALKESA